MRIARYRPRALPGSKFADGIQRSDLNPASPTRAAWMERRRAQRDRLAMTIFRRRKQNPSAVAIADSFEGCHHRNPCGSCACPVCYEAMANRFTDRVMEFLSRQCYPDASIFAITIVPDFGVLAGKELRSIDIQSFKRKLNLRLTRAGVGLMVGALEYSRDEHQTGRYP